MIWSLKDQGDKPITSFEGFANMGRKNFENLFKDDRRENLDDIIKIALYFPSFVDEEDNKKLFAEVIEIELKDTMQSFQKDKIPGLDRWTIEFYAGFFKQIGKDVLKVIEESRQNDIIHGPLNTTFLAPIPKLNDPLSFDDF
jgi:hypothetical protein